MNEYSLASAQLPPQILNLAAVLSLLCHECMGAVHLFWGGHGNACHTAAEVLAGCFYPCAGEWSASCPDAWQHLGRFLINCKMYKVFRCGV